MSGSAPGSGEIPEDLFERLVESISAVTYVMRFDHPDEAPLYVSPQCESVLGIPCEALMVDARGRNQLLHPEDRERLWERSINADATGEDWDEEYRLIQPDGSFRWVHSQARVVPASHGREALWFGVLTDLTRTTDAEHAHAESEAKYRALIEQIPGVIYVDSFEEQPKTLYVSPYTEQLTGYRTEEWINDPDLWIRVLHPDDQNLFARDWPANLDQGARSEHEYRLIHRDGHVVWVKDIARLIRSEDGTPLFWQGLILDISARRESEQRLRDSEARYRALVEDIPAYVYIATDEPDPSMTYVSPQVQEILGFAPERWIEDQDLWWKVMPPEQGHRMLAEWERCVRDRTTFSSEYAATRADGRTVWLHDTARLVRSADGESFYWHGVVLDITDAKLAEEALRESEGRYRLLVEHVPAVVYIDSNDEIPKSLYMSPNVTELFGITLDEYQDRPKRWDETIHPDDQGRVHERWLEALRTGERFRDEYRLIRPDGRIVWVNDDALLVRAPDGTPVHWQGVIQDITDRKLAEEEMQRSNARFRALVEQSPAVVYEMSLDDERRTLYVSPQVATLFGYSRQEWLDQPDIWTELLHPEDREITLAAHDQHSQTGEPWSQDYRLIASDGRVVWVRDQAVMLRDIEGRSPTWQGVMVDVTPQKELEERLRLMNDELELRVGERTAELEEANELMALEIGERRRVEMELREAHERYRNLVEAVPAVVYMWVVGPDRANDPRSYYSPQIEQLIGYSPEEWRHPTLWQDRVHPHDRDRVIAAAERSEDTGEPFEQEYRILAKDGHIVWVLDSCTLLARNSRGEPDLFQGVLVDLTARKMAEDRAREAEENLHAIAEHGPLASYAYELFREPEHRINILYATTNLAQLLGLEAKSFTIETLDELMALIHPDDRDEILASLAKQWATGEEITHELRLIVPDGRVVWVHTKTECVARDDQGRPFRFRSALIDITERKLEEERLRRSEAQLRSLVQRMPGIPWIEVVEGEPGSGRATFFGPQVEEVVGYTADELLAEPGHFERMVHPDDRERLLALSARHDRTEEPWSEEYRAITRDGRIRWLRSEGLASHDEQGRLVWHGVTFDITDQRSDLTVTLPEVDQADVKE